MTPTILSRIPCQATFIDEATRTRLTGTAVGVTWDDCVRFVVPGEAERLLAPEALLCHADLRLPPAAVEALSLTAPIECSKSDARYQQLPMLEQRGLITTEDAGIRQGVYGEKRTPRVHVRLTPLGRRVLTAKTGIWRTP